MSDEVPSNQYELRVVAEGPHATDPAHRGPSEAVHTFLDFLDRLRAYGHDIVAAHVVHHSDTADERVEVLVEPPATATATAVTSTEVQQLSVTEPASPAPGADPSGV